MILETKHKRFFELAKKISKKSNHHQHHLGCVIVKSGKIIGFGYNQIRTHPKATNKFNMLHAEVHGLLGLLPADTRGSIVYVYRENRSGQLAMSKPCPCCYKMLQDYGIRTVIYTTNEDYDTYSYY